MENTTKNENSECRSVFKTGDSTTTAQVTEKWIELINMLERNKLATVG